MQRLKKVSKEVREHIFEYIVMPWAPLDQYPVTDIPEAYSVGFARRNKTPLFEDKEVELKYLDAERPKLKKRIATGSLYCPDIGRGILSFADIILLGGVRRRYPLSPRPSHIQSAFSERCGLLDYFKESEHHNIIEFGKALERYEAAKKMADHHSDCKEQSREHFVGLLDEFIAWFWDSIVLDLKTGWVLMKCTPVTEEWKMAAIDDVWV